METGVCFVCLLWDRWGAFFLPILHCWLARMPFDEFNMLIRASEEKALAVTRA